MNWPSLHAALNDLPAALLLVSLVFEVFGALLKRDSLRATAYWTLVAGVIGAVLAGLAGMMAEKRVDQSTQAHDLIERHETLAFVVLGLFSALLLWRTVRRVLSKQEQTIYLTVAAIGVVLMMITARVGGSLVFGHGIGIPTAKLDSIRAERPAPAPAPAPVTRDTAR